MSTELVRIPFHGRELQAMLRQGEGHLVLRPACDDLGLDFSGQLQRLKRQPWATMGIMTTAGADSKERELVGLHVDSVPMWLATIQTSRVKPERRPLLIAYQKECARVLRDHFIGKAGPQQQSLPFDHVALRIELAELRGKVDALLQLRGRRGRAPALRRAAPADLTEKVRALVTDQAEAMTHAVIEGLGLALTRGNEMLVGQVLRALGFDRELRRRMAGGRVYVYTKRQAN